MFGNYLGIRGSSSSSSGTGAKYARNGNEATPSTICQKCLETGHYSYSCKKAVVYKARPSRTQQLKNPKLKTKLTGQMMDASELPSKIGTAEQILNANEAKRIKNSKAASSSSSSSSSSSGSDSDSGSGSGSDSGSNSSKRSNQKSSRRRRDSRSRSRSESIDRVRGKRTKREDSRSGSESESERDERKSVSKVADDDKGKGRSREDDDDRRN